MPSQSPSPRLSVTILLAVFASILAVLLAILPGLATSVIPSAISPYLRFAWPATGVVAFLFIGVSVWQACRGAIVRMPSLTPAQQKEEIASLMRKFNNQRAPGYLFGTKRNVILDKFGPSPDHIETDVDILANKSTIHADIHAKGDETLLDPDSNPRSRWIVATEPHSPESEVLQELSEIGQELEVKTWLVVFDHVSPETLAFAQKLKVMVTDIEGLSQLKKFLAV